MERWFAELANKGIRRDSLLSTDDLIAAINGFLAAWVRASALVSSSIIVTTRKSTRQFSPA